MSVCKKLRKNRSFLLNCVLTIISLFLIGRIIAYRKAIASNTLRKNYEILTDLSIAESRINGFKHKELLEIQADHCFLPNHLLYEIETYDSIYLSRIIQNTTLVYRFTQASCISCVIEDLESLNTVSDSIGTNRIIVIGGHESTRDLKAFINPMNLDFKCFNFAESLNIPLQTDLNENDVPFFMVVQPGLEVLLPYIRDDGDQNKKYLDRVTQYLYEVDNNY